MLSAEERRLWDHVRSTKLGQPPQTIQHLCRVKPLLEDDLVAAIATLKESTAAIEKQAESLQRYGKQPPLDPVKRTPLRSEGAPQDPSDPIGAQDALELQQLRFTVGEEMAALTSNFNAASGDALQMRRLIDQQLAQRLHLDDQELHALQEIAPRCDAVAEGEIALDWKALRLVKKLIQFTCEQKQCRLNRIYLQQLHGPLRHENGVEDGPSEQEFSLKTDLDSLYAEVQDVVAMSFAQEFEYPLIQLLQEDRRQQRISEDLSYQSILSTLSRSRQSLDDSVLSLESFYSYCASLDAMHAIYRRILAAGELTNEHESLFTPAADKLPCNDAASRALLQHIGISYNSSLDTTSLEQDLLNKVLKYRVPLAGRAPSSDESLGSILNINNASSQLLSFPALGHLQSMGAATLDASLRNLDDKVGLLKGKAETLELSKVVESGQARKHFLDTWA